MEAEKKNIEIVVMEKEAFLAYLELVQAAVKVLKQEEAGHSRTRKWGWVKNGR
jgi:CRISPR/Cas system CSM-associated protein Csm3 (group 7 of RAMP superfamily)